MKSKSKTNDSFITNDKIRTGKGKKEKAKGKRKGKRNSSLQSLESFWINNIFGHFVNIGFLDQHRNIKQNQKESKKSDHNVQAIQKAKENYRSKPWRTSG